MSHPVSTHDHENELPADEETVEELPENDIE